MLDSGMGAVSGLGLDVFQHIPYTRFAGNALDVFCSYAMSASLVYKLLEPAQLLNNCRRTIEQSMSRKDLQSSRKI
jgi:hypothetical protein